MAPGPIHLSTTPRSPTTTYTPLTPYTDNTTPSSPTLVTKTLLFPETEHTTKKSTPLHHHHHHSPPSPTTSIESFDILDAVAWRTSYYDTYTPTTPTSRRARRTCDVLRCCCRCSSRRRRQWEKRRSVAALAVLVAVLFVAACVVAGVVGLRWMGHRTRVREACVRRRGGLERCRADFEWARCVEGNGVGFCEGVVRL